MPKGDAREWVRTAFLSLLDDASPKGFAYTKGVLETLAVLHVLPEDTIEVWERRALEVAEGRCPAAVLGEKDVYGGDCSFGGRAWCAICGQLPEVENS